MRSLAAFTGAGYDKGRSWLVQALWFSLQNLVFVKWWFPRRLRPSLLRWFGANVGQQVFIRHNVRIHWPWKLTLGDNVWLGEDVWLLNLEPIVIASDVCVSQGAFLCTGSHDIKSPTFEYDNAPIVLEKQVWIAARATILRGVTVRSGSVVAAGVTVSHDVEANVLMRRQDRQGH